MIYQWMPYLEIVDSLDDNILRTAGLIHDFIQLRNNEPFDENIQFIIDNLCSN